jgi:hypothetical protein
MISGCTSQQAIEKARERGAKAGREEGRRAGEVAGFNTAADAAEKEAYRDMLNQLYLSGEFRRKPLYTIVVLVGFFALGFGLQWGTFYALRRVGNLRDIDYMVLPEEMNDVGLTDLAERTCLAPLAQTDL